MRTRVTIPDLMAAFLSEKKELRPREEGKLSQVRSFLRGRGGFGPKALETSKSPVIWSLGSSWRQAVRTLQKFIFNPEIWRMQKESVLKTQCMILFGHLPAWRETSFIFQGVSSPRAGMLPPTT